MCLLGTLSFANRRARSAIGFEVRHGLSPRPILSDAIVCLLGTLRSRMGERSTFGTRGIPRWVRKLRRTVGPLSSINPARHTSSLGIRSLRFRLRVPRPCIQTLPKTSARHRTRSTDEIWNLAHGAEQRPNEVPDCVRFPTFAKVCLLGTLSCGDTCAAVPRPREATISILIRTPGQSPGSRVL